MSKLTRNQLVTRRGFIQGAVRSAQLLGATAAVVSLTKRSSAAEKSTPNRLLYDVDRLRRTDPKLIQYQEVGRFVSPQPNARRMAIGPYEHLLVAAGKRIVEIDKAGAALGEIQLTDEPRCVTVGADGKIFAGLRDHVEVYDRAGERRAAWETPGQKSYFTGIAVGDEDVFVADAGARVVLRYDKSGKFISRIGEKNKDRNIPGFIVPSPFFDVELARDGLLRVTNPGRHRVEAYTREGDLEFFWGEPSMGIDGFCGCCNPINLALLNDGGYVTFEKGLPRVKIYSAEGKFESVVAGAESFTENAKVCGPNDCSVGGLDGVVDSQGRIYILDLVANTIRVMERKKGSV
jgi:hypothetical protein